MTILRRITPEDCCSVSRSNTKKSTYLHYDLWYKERSWSKSRRKYRDFSISRIRYIDSEYNTFIYQSTAQQVSTNKDITHSWSCSRKTILERISDRLMSKG